MYHPIYGEVTPKADAECKRKFGFTLTEQDPDDYDKYLSDYRDALCADCALAFGKHSKEICPKDF
uniref:Uncharacterized protein n=1 Tax=viral metagenome TaxID=1070528 RepID=A0A6M3L866_9ZZZZ